MLLARHRVSSLVWTLTAATSLAACVLDPKSSGELDDGATDTQDTVQAPPADGATSVASDGDGTGQYDGPDDPPDQACTDPECDTPAELQWSDTFSNDDYTWACDVAVDPIGRVALAWHVDPSGSNPQGRSGILLYDPSGNLLDATDEEGEIYGAIAFASDGTLRVRGATATGGNHFQEWASAFDTSLQPAWTQLYHDQSGWGQCGWGSRGIEVDDDDELITYEYICGEPYCPQSFVRRHAADGTLLWEQNPGGNGGYLLAPIAVGAGQSTFHGAVRSRNTYDEVEVRKYAADGTELWMTVIPGYVDGLWGAADGGVFAATRDFYSGGEKHVHRLATDGTYAWVAGPAADPVYRVVAPTADETGLYVLATDGLHRTSLSLETQWTAPIHDGNPDSASAADVLGDVFAFAGTGVPTRDDAWVTVLALP